MLNEFLKEHQQVQELKATVAKQQNDIATLTASLREQVARIQNVTVEVEMLKAAPRMVANGK